MICIAGKNKIAIFGVKLLLDLGVKKEDIVALTNKNDDGIDGWQPSFKRFCLKKKIEIVELKQLYGIKDLIFISLEYDRIIKTNLFKSKYLFNIHFSLLPAYKGMFTSVLPILNGEKTSGVTLHKIDDGIDTGDIIDQIEFDLKFGTTGLMLYELYISHSIKILINNINSILNLEFNSSRQKCIGASYYSNKTIDFSGLKIDFNKTCYEISNYVNAFTFRPYQLIKYNSFNLVGATSAKSKSNSRPGSLIYENKYLFEVSTIDYNVILMKDRQNDILDKAANNELETIKIYYDFGFDLDDKNSKGWNAFIVACYNGSFDVVKFIIDNKISKVNTINYKGTSALMYAMTNASETNNLLILKFLIENGADIRHKDFKGFDIFHYAYDLNNNIVINYLTKI
jgi:methionyl-tRNA formyltransferase